MKNRKRLSPKRNIREAGDRPWGMGTGGAPMQDQDDDFDLPPESGNSAFPHEDHWTDNEEAHDDPRDRPTFEESFRLPELPQLDERAGFDQVATSIRNALTDCTNLTSNIIQVITRKKPEWKEALKAVREAEEALDHARQALMSHG